MPKIYYIIFNDSIPWHCHALNKILLLQVKKICWKLLQHAATTKFCCVPTCTHNTFQLAMQQFCCSYYFTLTEFSKLRRITCCIIIGPIWLVINPIQTKTVEYTQKDHTSFSQIKLLKKQLKQTQRKRDHHLGETKYTSRHIKNGYHTLQNNFFAYW